MDAFSLTLTHHHYRTANPEIKFTMREVLKNQQLIGRFGVPPSCSNVDVEFV
jgi:hypothetical protein